MNPVSCPGLALKKPIDKGKAIVPHQGIQEGTSVSVRGSGLPDQRQDPILDEGSSGT